MLKMLLNMFFYDSLFFKMTVIYKKSELQKRLSDGLKQPESLIVIAINVFACKENNVVTNCVFSQQTSLGRTNKL